MYIYIYMYTHIYVYTYVGTLTVYNIAYHMLAFHSPPELQVGGAPLAEILREVLFGFSQSLRGS